MFTRMGDRFSTWDVSNGLQSIIPTLLTSSVAGYPFCLPDMIGEHSSAHILAVCLRVALQNT